MNYQEAMTYIEEKNRLGSELGLTQIRKLLQRMGNPQNRCKVVHIAGTNGKGSILSFMDAALQDAGYRVGRYSSPTIFTYLERFQINDTYMSEERFADLLSRVASHVSAMEADGEGTVTAFELETAIAFQYFYEEQVDVVLLETGMGGRLDATNVVERPLCTIIASISLDHTAILGSTIPEIAAEKAGILRDQVPCVIYPMNEEAMPVLLDACEKHNIQPIVPNLNELTIQKEDLLYETFAYKNVIYKSSLLGKHQIYNAITAIEALNTISSALIDTESEYKTNGLENVNIQNGLQHTGWKGRFEILEEHPYVIRDGAHNLDAANRLYEQLRKHFTKKRILYIIGVLRDKAHYEMFRKLVPLADKVYVLTVPDNPRALPAEELAEEVRQFCPEVVVTETPEQAYILAKQDAEPEDVIVAFGSLYYIGRIGDRNGTDR